MIKNPAVILCHAALHLALTQFPELAAAEAMLILDEHRFTHFHKPDRLDLELLAMLRRQIQLIRDGEA